MASVYVSIIGSSLMQGGWAIKNADSITVTFSAPFASIPAVVTTSEWNQAVGGEITITNVGATSFDIIGPNQAVSYFVNWIAMGNVGGSSQALNTPSKEANNDTP